LGNSSARLAIEIAPAADSWYLVSFKKEVLGIEPTVGSVEDFAQGDLSYEQVITYVVA
jgi:hypothetical protein